MPVLTRSRVDRSRFVSPLVRELSARLGVDPAAISGSGLGGRVRKQDLVTTAAPKPAVELMVAEIDLTVRVPAASLDDASASVQECLHRVTMDAAVRSMLTVSVTSVSRQLRGAVTASGEEVFRPRTIGLVCFRFDSSRLDAREVARVRDLLWAACEAPPT